jgi:molybdenum-dependent DNA-binding transcriptional regulator ModE
VQAGYVLYGDPYDWLRDWHDNLGRNGGGGAKGTRDVSVLVVPYEAMKRDLRREIDRIIAFLGLDVSEQRIQNVIRVRARPSW